MAKRKSKKELEEARRKNREKQSRWVKRQKEAGRMRVTYWLTMDERRFLGGVVKRLPELVEIDRQRAVSNNRAVPAPEGAKKARPKTDTSA